LTPAELVAKAALSGLEVVAITDHDTTDGVATATAAARQSNVTIVPGVEISTVSGEEEVHILGYFVDVHDVDLQALLTRARQARQERARKMLARLADLGLPISWDRLVELSNGSGALGRPHVAATLLEAGHISSWDEAFDLWIGRGCPAYVERFKLLPEEAIQLVRQSGGVAVLAHPFIYNQKGERKAALDLRRWIPRLCEAGLEGIEVYYPNYPQRATRHLLAMAVDLGLLITGGSDFHGGVPGSGLGSIDVPWATWLGLERRAVHRQARSGRQVKLRPSQSMALPRN
jgi:hypothetical protein